MRRVHTWDVVAWILRRPLLWWLRAEVSGIGNVPGSGGALLAANHLSHLDIFLVGVASPRTPRFIGKVELSSGFIGVLTKLCGMVPITRGRADMSPLTTVVDLLRDGDVVAVFPEGTRSQDGRLYKFRSGLGRLAAGAQVPTVPVTLVGTADVWPRGSKPLLQRPARGVVRIHFGDVVQAPADGAGPRRAFTEDVTAAIAGVAGLEPAGSFAPISA